MFGFNLEEALMIVYLVDIHVKMECVDDFIKATIDNASNSLNEPGIVQFGFVQQKEDPTCFKLIEVYKEPEAIIKHKETAHYLRWRDKIGNMMAEPRKGVQYSNIFPEDTKWS
jgi:(4S)-4-hydroxy-5-phosphonooxypentane-2,3-dione isomerase